MSAADVIARMFDRLGMPSFAADVRGGVRAWAAEDLTGWHVEHRTAGSGVWAVRPPCGYGRWTLYRPGAQRGPDGFSREEDVAGYHSATRKYGGDSDQTVLADIAWWLEVWVSAVAGAPVVGMVEGWSEPYGPDQDQQEYVIYVRTRSAR